MANTTVKGVRSKGRKWPRGEAGINTGIGGWRRKSYQSGIKYTQNSNLKMGRKTIGGGKDKKSTKTLKKKKKKKKKKKNNKKNKKKNKEPYSNSKNTAKIIQAWHIVKQSKTTPEKTKGVSDKHG